MTATFVGILPATVFLDTADLDELETTGVLRFSLGDRSFELRTRPAPYDDPYSIRVDLEMLREYRRASFRRSWGRLVIELAEVTR